MAAGLEETGVENLLTDTERRLLTEDAERQTAYAVLALNAVSVELGIEDNVLEAAAALRVSMDNLSLKERRLVRKSLEKVGALLLTGKPQQVAEVLNLPEPAPLESVVEPARVEDEPEEPDVPEPTPELAIASEATSSVATPDLAENKDEVDGKAADKPLVFDQKAVKQFYSRINAKSATGSLLEFEPYDEDEVLGLIALYAQHNVKQKEGLKSASRLTLRLEGKSFEDIRQAELDEGNTLSSSTYTQFVSVGAPTFIGKQLQKLFSGEELPEQKTIVPEPLATPSLLEEPKAEQVSAPMAEPVVTHEAEVKKPSIERSFEDEPPHEQLTARLAKVLGFDSSEIAAFRSMLDPQNRRADFTADKARVCNKVVEELVRTGTNDLHSGAFGDAMPRSQAARVYQLFGLRFENNVLLSTERLPKNYSVADQVEQASNNGGRPEETKRAIYCGLHVIISELERYYSTSK